MIAAGVVAVTPDDVAEPVDTAGNCEYGAWDVDGSEGASPPVT